MEKRKTTWYSIIRYSPNNLSGEIVNVGLVLHSPYDDKNLHYLVLDENTHKLRSIANNKVESNIYKSFKDTLEYYLSKCNEDLSGQVGNITIGSSYEPKFLDEIYENYLDCKLTLTKPSFALTENVDMLFNALVKTYIGEQYLMTEHKTTTVKKHIKQLFENRNLIGRKVKSDLEFSPIVGLEDLMIKVDFGFKNGVWNYIEAIPTLRNPSEISEWFAKTKFTLETIKSKDASAKIHLAYKLSDIQKDIIPMFDYLSENNQNVIRLNIEEDKKLNALCDYIEREAEEFIAS